VSQITRRCVIPLYSPTIFHLSIRYSQMKKDVYMPRPSKEESSGWVLVWYLQPRRRLLCPDQPASAFRSGSLPCPCIGQKSTFILCRRERKRLPTA